MPRALRFCTALAAALLSAAALPRQLPAVGRRPGDQGALAVGQASHEGVISDNDLSYDDLPLEASAGFARNCDSPLYARATDEVRSELLKGADNEGNSDALAGSHESDRHDPFARPTPWMYKLNQSTWTEIPPIPYQDRPVKLALLMFVKDSVNNEQVWHAWLKRARQDNLSFGMYIHAHGIEGPSEFQSPKLAEYVVDGKAPSKWCDIWKPQMKLLMRALQDPDVSHMQILSEDSIPVKPMRDPLLADPVTRMCADNKWRKEWPRAESWWLMRREDAQTFVENQDFAKHHFVRGCAEEQAWYFPLKLREARWGEEQVRVRNECPMFTNWMDGPKACKNWRWNVDLCTGCDALRSSEHRPAGFMHPVVYTDVNSTALRGLVESQFWFARKFTEGAITEDAARLLR
ncbi:unnamed protein product [Prorocentrum cordatum]|uniref:Protein xylosyltransferase n=1 Tax=Prorocentrum cordatum TaxID=2364126 RepID=A0ABN9SH73_9DINO|nr:unnamed protein product [Polarella glacialis]